ncbi:unnamed protein product [Amaranthus hypochondriacus]
MLLPYRMAHSESNHLNSNESSICSFIKLSNGRHDVSSDNTQFVCKFQDQGTLVLELEPLKKMKARYLPRCTKARKEGISVETTR